MTDFSADSRRALFRGGLMAADPRGLDDLVAPLEGDDGAVRSPGALASAE